MALSALHHPHPAPRRSALRREPIVMACTCEIAGRVRGKGFPARELPARLLRGVGWIPTNTMISALGPTANSPFGARDDLILVPDPHAEVHVDFDDGSAAEWFFLSDLRHVDGTPWMGCPREALRRALAALRAACGAELLAAFEHEFTYDGIQDRPGAPYSLDAFRQQGVFGEALLAAMRSAGVEPDSFLPEFAPRQFEVTCAPAPGLRAADHAVITREMARAVAHRLGRRVSFAPIHDPDGVGNGVHVHLSLRDADGRGVMHDAGDTLGLSRLGRQFLAGILDHMPALCAVTAPCPVSYIRLRPNRWAPVAASLARQDREAALRICPVLSVPGSDAAARQFNVEYRPADGAASPYLALAAIVHAGVDGIARGLDLPDPDAPARPLPASLGEALDLLEASAAATGWFGAVYLDAYLRHKRAEIAMTAELDERARCALYSEVY